MSQILLKLPLVAAMAACSMAGCMPADSDAPSPAALPSTYISPAEQWRDTVNAITEARIVDLSHTYDASTIYWPTDTKGFQLTTVFDGETDGGYHYSANDLCTAEHGGTHLDAPIHFAAGGHTADRVPLESLIGPAAVIDVSPQAAADADYLLSADDIAAFEAEHGTIAAGTIVLLRTGWSERWPDTLAYLGDDTPGDASNLHFPSFCAEAAQLLIAERQIAALGVDTASIDFGASKDFIVHQIAGGANVPAFENIANLGELPATGALVFALPMKIGGGSGGPMRMVALLRE